MKIGDVVQLNAGGPCMSVSAADPDAIDNRPLGIVNCDWFNVDHDFDDEEFYVCQLILK